MHQGVFSVCCATESFTEEEKGKRSEERIVAKTREIEEKTEEMWRDIAERQRREEEAEREREVSKETYYWTNCSEKKKSLGKAYLRNPNDDTWFAFVHADDNEPLEELPPFWELVVAHALDNPLANPLAFYIPKALNIFEPVDRFFINKRDIIKYKDFPQLMSAKSYEEWKKLKALAEVIKYLRRVKASYGTGANIVATVADISLILAIILIIKKLAPFVIVFLGLASFRSSFFTLDRTMYGSKLETLFGRVDEFYVRDFYLLRVLLFFAVVYCLKKQKFRMYCVKHRFSMLATFAFCVPLFWDFGMLPTVNFLGLLAIAGCLFEIYLRYQQK